MPKTCLKIENMSSKSLTDVSSVKLDKYKIDCMSTAIYMKQNKT